MERSFLMKTARHFHASGILLFLITSLLLGITGCSSGGSDSGTASWWDSGVGETAQTLSVSGTLRDTITNNPVQGATCTLLRTRGGNFIEDFMRIPKETVTVSTTTTGADGTYRLTGVPSGTYTLKFTKTDYINSEVNDLSVTGDTANIDHTIVQTSQWNQIAGPDYPYDDTKDYLIVDASLPDKGVRPAVSGVAATIIPSAGVKIGYFTDSTPPTIDWNATSTYSNGRIIFYGLTPGTQYSITFTLAGYTFPTLSVTSPGGGGVQNYNIYATSPTPSPTQPTPSPSPTVSPQPSPSPSPTTSPGGGGGGGGTAALSITTINPDSGPAGTEVTITGTGFGAPQGNSRVSFNGTDAAAGDYVSWSATEIKVKVPAGAATGNIVVTVGSQVSNGKMFTCTPSGTIHGTITDAHNSGTLLGGVTVTAGGVTGTTNLNGYYKLENVPEGAQTVKATKTGYAEKTQDVTVTADETLLQNLAMTPTSEGPWDYTFNKTDYAGQGSGLTSVVTGDFNKDGDLDLAVSNYGSDSVSIFLGNGTGGFTEPNLPVAVGTDPYLIAAGDFNGDGNLDLAVPNNGSQSVSILIGDGTGAFTNAAESPFATGTIQPSSVAIGDYNSDGKLDFAVTQTNQSQISIFIGDGDGTFTAGSTFSSGGTWAIHVAAGDFDGDGNLDLACANYGNNLIAIFKGKGDGTFDAPTTFGAGTAPYAVAIGDLNCDGKMDLAVTNRNSSNISIFLGDGDGTFTVPAGSPFAAVSSPTFTTIGDFNGDGKPDLAVANNGGTALSVLLGNKDGTFNAKTDFDVGGNPYSAATGDFNGDRKPDLATANNGGVKPISILLNDITHD